MKSNTRSWISGRTVLVPGLLAVLITILLTPDWARADLIHQWSQRYGDSGDQKAHWVRADSHGNIVVVGYLSSPVDFGGGPLVPTPVPWNSYIVKFGPGGNHVWSRLIGPRSTCEAVDTDQAGNVYLTGLFFDNIDLGGGPVYSTGMSDMYLAKLDPNGGLLWCKGFGDENDKINVKSICTNDLGHVVILGAFKYNLDLGGGPLTSADLYDIFVAKYDADGQHEWSHGFGGAYDQWPEDVCIDDGDNVIVTGENSGTVDFGGGELVSEDRSQDVILAKFHPDGNHLWSFEFGGPRNQAGECVAVDRSGDIILAGQFDGDIDFGGGVLHNSGDPDIFIAKIAPDGSHRWSRRFGEPVFVWVRSVKTDRYDNVVLTGGFVRNVDFGGDALTTPEGSYGQNVFLAKFDPQGNHVWSYGFGDENGQYAERICIDHSNNLILAGYHMGEVDFGGGPLVSPGNNFDIMLAKFEVDDPTGVPSSPTVDVCPVRSFPNPFNPWTIISYVVASGGPVTLCVYDVNGKLVDTLLDQEFKPAGEHHIRYTTSGPSGVYFVRIHTPSQVWNAKIVCLK